MRAVLVLAIAAILTVAAPVSGQVPMTMNYQVMLTDNMDEPLADQAVTLVFRIYNADIGGVMLWNETHATATNSIGVVSVVLGTTIPLSLNLFIGPRWVEVEVDGETLSPRRELTSSPDALLANDSDRLGLIAADDYALEEDLGTPGSINNPANPVDWTMLKNVPSGFADGNDDVGGARDGHSLDADDGDPVDAVYVGSTGIVKFGSSVSNGVAEFYASGGANPSIYLNGNHGFGGELELYEEDGTRYAYFEPDVNGTGGYLQVLDGDGGYDGFYVDGNRTGGNAYVGIEGSGSSTGFNTNATGNGAVTLPTDAVSAYEILDEPGAASTSGYLSITMTTSIQTLLSRSITVPAPGYVLAVASAEVATNHSNGTPSGCNFGVSNSSSSYPLGGETYLRIPDNAPDGGWYPGLAVQWLFEVASAGTHTFYFIGDETVGDWQVFDRYMTLVYIPSAYGTIASAVAAPPSNPEETTVETGHALTEADIVAERAESEAFNNARIERELAEMEAKIAEIRASMGNGNKQ